MLDSGASNRGSYFQLLLDYPQVVLQRGVVKADNMHEMPFLFSKMSQKA